MTHASATAGAMVTMRVDINYPLLPDTYHSGHCLSSDPAIATLLSNSRKSS